jgi:hypothetical protein
MDSLKNKFAILRLKCVADLADLIERNHRRSCSTSRISRMKSSQRCDTIRHHNVKLFLSESYVHSLFIEPGVRGLNVLLELGDLAEQAFVLYAGNPL